jgi:hypothetical protein
MRIKVDSIEGFILIVYSSQIVKLNRENKNELYSN